MTIWRTRIACWITKATNTHSQYVILIVYPLQKWLHERASMLGYSTLHVLYLFTVDPLTVLHTSGPVLLNRGAAARYRPWHQLYRAARSSPGSYRFSFLSIFHE